ncbi:MAG: hypothetical protein GF311_19595 [Candidatus Lokiarchaeota archaeon]|nr:hypothetical protein [Candidatus Lokiarchaeota archaeon]
MEMEKKNIAIIALAVLLIASGAGNVYFLVAGQFAAAPQRTNTLLVGTAGNIPDLDPHYAWDSASIDVINQVCEGLVRNDLDDPLYTPIPSLATNWSVSPDGLEYTFTLRKNITFHDGWAFNATVVKWNFDRLNHFLNWSGNSWLPAPFNESIAGDVHLTQLSSLILTADGSKPLMNETIVLDDYTVKIVLNEEKGPFLPELCFAGFKFMTPNPAYTPLHDYMTGVDNILVGTGPFKFTSFTPDVEVRFTRFEDYWRGLARVQTVIFVQIEDGNTRNQALLSKEIDLLTAPLPGFLDQFDADPGIVRIQAGPTTSTNYLMLDCEFMNKSFREAISYGFDYDFYISDTLEDQGLRLRSPIPNGVQYSNYSKNCPIYNVTYARQVLIDDGIAPAAASGWTTQQWRDRAASNPFAAWNYTYNIESDTRLQIGQQLVSDMADIGIEVTLVTADTWTDVIIAQIRAPETLQFYPMGWIPDYNDAENYLSPFFSNVSFINGMRYYEPDVEVLMRTAATESNTTIRAQLYEQIQTLMIERDFPCLWLSTSLDNDCYVKNLIGWEPNGIGFLDLYPVALK